MPRRNVDHSRCSSNSLAVDLGRCLAARLVVWLLPHAPALHAHVVCSSVIAVLAVVWMVHIRRAVEKAKPDDMYPGSSPVVVSLVLCWITWIPLLYPGIISTPIS